MSMAFDGSGVTATAAFGGSPSTALPSLTTTNAGCVVFLFSFNRAGHINSIDGSSLGTGALSQAVASASPSFELWAGIAVSALTSEVLTVNHSSNFDHGYAAYCVSGSGLSSLVGAFETAVAIEGSTLPVNFTTTHATAMILAGSSFIFGATPGSFGTGFTSPAAQPLASVWGKPLTSTATEAITTDQDGLSNGYLVTALIGGGGGPPPVAKGRVGLQAIGDGFTGALQRHGGLHPIGKGIIGWRKGLILPKRVIHTVKRAA